MSVVTEDYYDHREVTRDLIDLLNELADLLAATASHGEFGRHLAFCMQADALMAKLTRSVSPGVVNLYRHEAESVIARLRAQFQLIDVQGRA